MIIIGVTLPQLLRRPRHVPLANTCSNMSYHTAKHRFTAVLVPFLYFIPPKRKKTVAALTSCGGTNCGLFATSHP